MPLNKSPKSCYLCLFVYSGVQHILCCVCVLFFFVSCTLCCQFLWIVHFWLPIRYSLTFIWNNWFIWLYVTIFTSHHNWKGMPAVTWIDQNRYKMIIQESHRIGKYRGNSISYHWKNEKQKNKNKNKNKTKN